MIAERLRSLHRTDTIYHGYVRDQKTFEDRIAELCPIVHHEPNVGCTALDKACRRLHGVVLGEVEAGRLVLDGIQKFLLHHVQASSVE